MLDAVGALAMNLCGLLAGISIWMVTGGLSAMHLTRAWFARPVPPTAWAPTERTIAALTGLLALGGPATFLIAAVYQIADRHGRPRA